MPGFFLFEYAVFLLFEFEGGFFLKVFFLFEYEGFFYFILLEVLDNIMIQDVL